MRHHFSLSTSKLLLACLVSSFFLYSPNFSVQTIDPNNVGTDLYFAQAVTKGQVPYRDFNEIYGPLMDYFNGLLMVLLGFNIHSLIWGKVILKTISSGIFFLAATRIMPSLFALVASLAFTVFTPDFTHNIKSYAVICVETGGLWMILSYFNAPKKKYMIGAAVCTLLTGFIKLNHGISLLGASVISFILCDLFKYKDSIPRFLVKYAIYSISMVSIFFVFYYIHLKGLTLNEIQQCLPYFKGYVYFNGSMAEGFINLIKSAINDLPRDYLNSIVGAVIVITVIRLSLRFYSLDDCTARAMSFFRNNILTLIILLICIGISNNEYYKGRIEYQTWYSRPYSVMIIAFLVSEASLISGVLIQRLSLVFFSVLIAVYAFYNWKSLENYKDPSHFFAYKGINIHVTNDPRDMRTMIQTAQYIDKNIPRQGTFFSFPDNGIYYFLTNRPSPTRLIFLFGAVKIKPEQEIGLINELERKGNQFIVLDNICYSGVSLRGVFGKDNCLLLYKYLKKYFQEVAEFGNVPGGFVGTRIYKKKTSQFIIIRKPQDLD